MTTGTRQIGFDLSSSIERGDVFRSYETGRGYLILEKRYLPDMSISYVCAVTGTARQTIINERSFILNPHYARVFKAKREALTNGSS